MKKAAMAKQTRYTAKNPTTLSHCSLKRAGEEYTGVETKSLQSPGICKCKHKLSDFFKKHQI